MVQRVTISISDNLHERLRTVRNAVADGEVFNTSCICQEAIENEIIRLEDLKERLKKLSSINISRISTGALEKVINEMEHVE